MVVISQFNTDAIYNDFTFKDTISSLQISNYSNSPLSVKHKGVEQIVPAYDPANETPPYYKIDGDGTFSLVELQIKYANPVKNGYAVISSRTLCKN